MLGVRLEQELEKELDSYVNKTKENRSTVVKRAITEFLLRQQADEAHDRITEAALRDIKKGNYVSKKSVLAYLKTWKNK